VQATFAEFKMTWAKVLYTMAKAGAKAAGKLITSEPQRRPIGVTAMAIFDLGIETGNTLYAWGWRLSLVAGIGTAFGIAMLMLGTLIRDEHSESKIHQLESTLEKVRSPRAVKDPAAVVGRLNQFAGTLFDFACAGEPEPMELMDRLAAALEQAGWVRTAATHAMDPREDFQMLELPVSGKPPAALGLYPAGIQIQVAESKFTEWGAAATALQAALNVDGLESVAVIPPYNYTRDNAVHIRIGRRL
jgi:hypothetical protein